MTLINILVFFVILAIVIILGKWVIDLTGAPQPLKIVLILILVLLCVLWFANGTPFIRLR